MSSHGDSLAASSIVLSTVTVAWFAMVPSFHDVHVNDSTNDSFDTELHNAEVTVSAISLSFAAIVSFYLKDYVPLLLCGVTLAILTFVYEREYKTN